VKLQIYFQTLVPAIKTQIVNSGLDFEEGGWKHGISQEVIESFEQFSIESILVNKKELQNIS
jgi:hypothetical protein